tara:strand:+ start:97 stop:207 length:111 start_codon:yes stop_codon:yes gene_type:complete
VQRKKGKIKVWKDGHDIDSRMGLVIKTIKKLKEGIV